MSVPIELEFGADLNDVANQLIERHKERAHVA